MSIQSTNSGDTSTENTAETTAETTAEITVDDDLSSLASSISIADNSRKDPDYVPVGGGKEKEPPKRKTEELINERIAGILDKCLISARYAVHLIVAILLALLKDPRDYKVSFSTIRQRRSEFRVAIYDTVKDTIQIGRGSVVHFDGKLMDAITGNSKVDRLAVKVTYRDVDQLLGD